MLEAQSSSTLENFSARSCLYERIHTYKVFAHCFKLFSADEIFYSVVKQFSILFAVLLSLASFRSPLFRALLASLPRESKRVFSVLFSVFFSKNVFRLFGALQPSLDSWCSSRRFCVFCACMINSGTDTV